MRHPHLVWNHWKSMTPSTCASACMETLEAATTDLHLQWQGDIGPFRHMAQGRLHVPRKDKGRIQTVINIFMHINHPDWVWNGSKGVLSPQAQDPTCHNESLQPALPNFTPAGCQPAVASNSDNWCETSKTGTTCPGKPRVEKKM